MGFTAEGISSDMTQDEREKALQGFKNKKYQIVVATDILSRGIDIDSLSHVVNFDMPQDAEDYVHRVGRTARAASTGMAITFVNEKDMHRVQKVERLIERELPKLPLPDDFGAAPVYDPSKRHDTGLRRGNRPGSGGNKKDHRSKHHRGGKPAGKRQEEGSNRPVKAASQPERAEGNSPSAVAGEAGSKPRKRNNRNRNRNRDGASNQKPQEGNQSPAS
jgi:superfamily II DNA/RNA helicase